ncbi:MAG: dicarboxylate/amino acid:cation symporter [Puniceicoccales bacterium]|jgi:Na+/H+-dicarboxylate symporter|nr:dicarboxylate/amino acid:cation symporter [Puniceicoccales bacterium]
MGGRSKLVKFVRNPLLQLIVAMVLCSCFHARMSRDSIRFFLTISSCLKELLVFVLPFLLFSFIAVALSAIPKEGMLFVLALMVAVFASNFINILISGCIGYAALSGASASGMHGDVLPIVPLFSMQLPQIATTLQALVFGVITGFINSFYPTKCVNFTIGRIHACVMLFMKRFFIPALPIFVSGFLLKLFAEGRMTGFLRGNFRVCLLMFASLLCYLTLWLFIAAAFRRGRALEILKNAFPAMVTAFSTMSSAAALPLSLEAAHKNTKDKVLADVVMPLTLNFHMLGDTIIVPILAMTVMLAFNHPLPSVHSYVLFGILFVLNKFAGAGVPSGTIMVTVPILKDIFGFDDAMVAFTIALYGVIDPVATMGNVTANNFFIVIFQRARNFLKRKFSARRT